MLRRLFKVRNFAMQVASDLHLERHDKTFDRLIVPSADYLALAGDIGSIDDPRNKERYIKFLEYCSRNFKQVYLIPGNHEYYSTPREPKTMSAIDKELDTICDYFHNVYFLQTRAVKIDTTAFRIIGATMWSNIPSYAYHQVNTQIRDYRNIYHGDELVTVPHINKIHISQSKFIEDELKKDGDAIVLTHHAPLTRGTSMPFFEELQVNGLRQPMSTAFSSHMDYLFEHASLRCWIFGHTHFQTDFKFKNVRVISNPHGYIGKRTYNRKKIIEFPLK